MVARKAASKAGSPEAGSIKVTDDGRLAVNDGAATSRDNANDGGAGPKSSLKTGEPVGGDGAGAVTKRLNYSVQIHTDEKGLEVFEPIAADSGDEAAKIALAKKNYRGASVRGVTPYSDPDANSLGGERDAGIMIANAENDGAVINTLGTDANREATEKLGRADVSELGE